MKFCEHCGTELNDNDKFCFKCGTSCGVNNNYSNQTNTKVEDSECSEKSRLVASLLAFFLGGFGAMDFYIGKKATGFVKLGLFIFVFILSIVWYVSIMNYASSNQGQMTEEELYSKMFDFKFVLIWLISFGMGIWNLVDLILTLCGAKKDKDGLKVVNWH